MQHDMRNIAYTKEYIDSVCYYEDRLFETENFHEKALNKIDDEITVYTQDYIKEDFYDKRLDCSYRLSGSVNSVFRNDEKIYDFKTINISRVYSAFSHQNGHKYLVFTKDLYGYSVLDLNTMQVFNYFPAASFSTKQHQCDETFIWCDIHYNADNNIVAVDGCFWAAPSSVLLADFTDPMKETIQIDVNDFASTEYTEVNFLAWNRTDLIVNEGYHGNQKQKIISDDEYMSWLNYEEN